LVSPIVKKKVIRNAKLFKDDFYKYFMDVVREDIPDIIDKTNEIYNDELNGRVKDRSSKVIAENYQNEFVDQMWEYDYTLLEFDGVSLRCPDMDDFPFEIRKLSSLQTILEGMPYNAIEIPHEQYEIITGKKPFTKQPFDSSVLLRDRIYVERKTTKIVNVANSLNIRLAPYAYSRMPPVDIFESIKIYMKEQEKRWRKTAETLAKKSFGKK